jgi:hypothetical protein
VFFVPGCNEYLADVIIAEDPVVVTKVLNLFSMSNVETVDMDEQYACNR